MQPHLSRLATRLTAAAAMLAVATITHAAEKRVIYVDKSAPPGGDGTSWSKAFQNLTSVCEIFDLIPKTDVEIRIARGVYTPIKPGGERTKRFVFSLSNEQVLGIKGGYAGTTAPDPNKRDIVSTPTVLSADVNGDDGPGFTNRSDNTLVVLQVQWSGSLELDGVVIRGVTPIPDCGISAGLMVNVGTIAPSSGPERNVWLTNCIFEENDGASGKGAGAAIFGGSIVVDHCQFRRNRGGLAGGGLYAQASSGPMVIQFSSFSENSARFGGAFYGEQAIIDSCVFVRNEAAVQGGAVFGARSIESSLFLFNASLSSGGAVAGFDELAVKFSTFEGNAAPTGSAISTYNSSAALYNSILWNNPTQSDAPQIRYVDPIDPPRIGGCVIKGGMQSVLVSGETVIPNPPIATGDPEFIRPLGEPFTSDDWMTWNYRVRPNSSARGIGDRDVHTGFDLDGRFYFRLVTEARPDAGCYWITRSDCAADFAADIASVFPRDFVVDDSDFQLFAAAYELTIAPPANPLADLNNDGLVDDADFSLFAVAYDELICP